MNFILTLLCLLLLIASTCLAMISDFFDWLSRLSGRALDRIALRIETRYDNKTDTMSS